MKKQSQPNLRQSESWSWHRSRIGEPDQAVAEVPDSIAPQSRSQPETFQTIINKKKESKKLFLYIYENKRDAIGYRIEYAINYRVKYAIGYSIE